MLRCLLTLLCVLPAAAFPVPKGAGGPDGKNSNALLKAHAGKVVADASTSYNGWGVEKLLDGNEETSWFSGDGDGSRQGKKPWIRITFPEDVTVRRVTILGNREPNHPTGYCPLEGTFEFLDKNGKAIHTVDATSVGNKRDFDCNFHRPRSGVRAIRFTSNKDEEQLSCIGLAEILVE